LRSAVEGDGHAVERKDRDRFRILAGELGASGVRALCIRPHAIPGAIPAGSHSADVFGGVAARNGVSVDQLLAGMADATLLKQLPTLDQVADVAAFLASDRAASMTGTVANLTAGFLVD
jgi:NAD(P)-dependent dehydrogenase (short-subunit alcohol dehydrogenase family)